MWGRWGCLGTVNRSGVSRVAGAVVVAGEGWSSGGPGAGGRAGCIRGERRGGGGESGDLRILGLVVARMEGLRMGVGGKGGVRVPNPVGYVLGEIGGLG